MGILQYLTIIFTFMFSYTQTPKSLVPSSF